VSAFFSSTFTSVPEASAAFAASFASRAFNSATFLSASSVSLAAAITLALIPLDYSSSSLILAFFSPTCAVVKTLL
jgi:hypothetical protein